MTKKNNRKYRLLSAIKPSRPFVFLGLVYLAGLALFGLFRLWFALRYSDQLAGVSIVDIAHAFLIGVRFDTVVILYVLIMPLIVVPWLTLRRKLVRVSLSVYLTVLFSACFLMLVGDIHFFRISQSHLNYLALDYLKDGRTAWNLVLSEPGFYVGVIGWLVVSVLFGRLVLKLMKMTEGRPERFSWIGQATWWLVLMAVAVVGVRGRTALSPMRWGVAYFSDNHFVNQLGLNGIWSIVQTFESEDGDPRLVYLKPEQRFPLVPFGEALSSVQEMLNGPTDEWLTKDSSVFRFTRQAENRFGFDPNVILIMMESFSGRLTGALGSDLDLTPNFDRLASQGILFDNFYAGGERTSYGMAATLASSPALPGRSVQKRYGAAHPFRTLTEILNERSYYNLLAYGGDKVFDNIEGFYRSKKYDAVLGDDDFGRELVFAKWGIPDHVLFDRVIAMTDSLPRPFQITILTLSNHEPFDLPDSSVWKFKDDSYLSKIHNAFVYADYALGRFIDSLSQHPVFDSTVFLFVADHARYEGAKLSVDPSNFHVPLLIYAPTLLGDSGQTISTVGGQVDILPTLMGLLGDNYEHSSWGRDLLAVDSTDSGFALLRVGDRVGWIEAGHIYIEPLGRTPSLFRLGELSDSVVDYSSSSPEIFKRMQSRLRHYLQAAEQLTTPGSIRYLPGLDSSSVTPSR